MQTETSLPFFGNVKSAINYFIVRHGRKFVITVPYIWLVLFFLIPFLIIFKISFSERILGIPPYTQLLSWQDGQLLISISLNNYLLTLEDSLDFYAYLQTLKIAILLSFLIVFIKEFYYYKLTTRWHLKRKVALSLLFYMCVSFVVIRLLAYINLTDREVLILLFILLVSASGYYWAFRRELWMPTIQKAIVILLFTTFILFSMVHVFDWFEMGTSNWLNDHLDHILSVLHVIQQPIMNIDTNLADSVYVDGYIQSIKIASVSTVLCILVGYPLAWAIARSDASVRNILLLLVILPSWTSFLIRIYAWSTILRNNGLLNYFLISIGIIDKPLIIMNTNIAVYIGIVYAYLPFVVLPIYNSLTKIDLTLIEAASDLGCKPIKVFFSVILPLTKNGVIAGGMLVLIPSVGEYVIPELLGGSNTNMIGRVLWEEFFKNTDWPVASAVASIMLLLLIVPILYFNKQQSTQLEAK